MYANGEGLNRDIETAIKYQREAERFQNSRESLSADSYQYTLNGIEYLSDKVIPGLLPPEFNYKIREGSCGEACLWSIVNSRRYTVSQIEINVAGGAPGRGLHANELHRPLDSCGIRYTDHIAKPYFHYALAFLNPVNLLTDQSEKYRDYLYNLLIKNLRDGNPIILGVKKYPTKHSFWDCDHFILLVGYNEETNEIIFNDFNERKRIDADKLLDTTEGYSLVNRYNFLNYILIENF